MNLGKTALFAYNALNCCKELLHSGSAVTHPQRVDGWEGSRREPLQGLDEGSREPQCDEFGVGVVFIQNVSEALGYGSLVGDPRR